MRLDKEAEQLIPSYFQWDILIYLISGDLKR